MSVNERLRDPLLTQLFEGVLSLQDIDECYEFFEDLCTISELKTLAQRLEVAKMLQAGEIYEHIADRTGASTATISRVKRSLVYGADGYTKVLKRLSRDSEGKYGTAEKTK